MSTKWYLAGPMTGIPQFNFPYFDKVAAALRAQGIDVTSPSEMDSPEIRAAALASPDGIPNERTSGGHTWGDFLARDLKLIADQVDGVILMDAWYKSKGARQEAFTALQCGKMFASLCTGKEGSYSIRATATQHVSLALRAYLQDQFG